MRVQCLPMGFFGATTGLYTSWGAYRKVLPFLPSSRAPALRINAGWGFLCEKFLSNCTRNSTNPSGGLVSFLCTSPVRRRLLVSLETEFWDSWSLRVSKACTSLYSLSFGEGGTYGSSCEGVTEGILGTTVEYHRIGALLGTRDLHISLLTLSFGEGGNLWRSDSVLVLVHVAPNIHGGRHVFSFLCPVRLRLRGNPRSLEELLAWGVLCLETSQPVVRLQFEGYVGIRSRHSTDKCVT